VPARQPPLPRPPAQRETAARAEALSPQRRLFATRPARFGALLLFGACARVDSREYPVVSELRNELAVASATAAREGGRCADVARQRQGLFVPVGGRLTLHADLPARGALRFGRLQRCGEAQPLQILARTDAQQRRVEIENSARDVALRLPRRGGPARLELRVAAPRAGTAVPGAATTNAGWIVLGLGLGARPLPASTTPAPPPRPHILVYLIDALRRDALGCYGARRGVSPHLDRLAREGALFDDAIAQASWTRPAVASLFTGLLPASHGVQTRREALAEEADTLAEALRRAGYRTAALVQNINVSGRLGFRQGFELLRQRILPRDHAEGLNGELDAWLARGDGRPFFAYLHTIEPHGPYEPPAALRRVFAPEVPADRGTRRALRALATSSGADRRRAAAELRALYDAEVARNDAAFGALRSLLERRGLWPRTVVVVLADHGEEFFEHGDWEHGHGLHAESVRIPLIVRVPGLPPRRVTTLAQQADLVPTLLGLAGVPPPARSDGHSLLPALLGAAPLAPRAVRSYDRLEDRDEIAVTTPRFRLLVRRFAGGRQQLALYDRAADPGERRDVQRRFPIAAAYLQGVVRWPLAGGAPLARPAGRLDREAAAQLRALGYIQ
jgi:arylsulfatase A-like enzyme